MFSVFAGGGVVKINWFLFSMVVRLIAREISPRPTLLLNPFCKTHLNGLGDERNMSS